MLAVTEQKGNLEQFTGENRRADVDLTSGSAHVLLRINRARIQLSGIGML